MIKGKTSEHHRDADTTTNTASKTIIVIIISWSAPFTGSSILDEIGSFGHRIARKRKKERTVELPCCKPRATPTSSQATRIEN